MWLSLQGSGQDVRALVITNHPPLAEKRGNLILPASVIPAKTGIQSLDL